MITLTELLGGMTIPAILAWAYSLDPNSSWDESMAADPTITRDALLAAMLAAYDDADTHAWINRNG
jgi:hypothetical protein